MSTSEIYTQASHQAHLAACARCRDIAAAIEARAAENGASMARRDRAQLGLRLTGTKAVTVR